MATISKETKGASSSKNVHLSSNDRNSMFHYYMTLNKYYHSNKEASEEVDRSTSSRALKARKRLLNLSTYQFFELTTDVNDEVERRMNTELNGDYLLPKETLHLKRNQARQKLANLSQKRFLDLVDDLSFEIRRRQYDLDPQFDAPYDEEDSIEEPNLNLKESKQNTKTGNLGSSTTATELDNEVLETDKPLTNKPSVQHVNVKTANLDWSDDEDVPSPQGAASIGNENNNSKDDFDLPEGFQKRSLQISNTSEAGLNKKNGTNASLNGKRNSVEKDLSILEKDLALEASTSISNKNNAAHEQKLQAAIDDINLKHLSLLAKNDQLKEDHKKLEETYSILVGQNENLLKEFKLNQTIVQELKYKLELAEKTTLNKEYQNKEYSSMVSKVEGLSIENETLKQQIMDLEIKDQLLDVTNDIKTNLFDENDISGFVNENSYKNGLIRVQSIKDFQKSIYDFYTKLQTYKQKDNNKELFLEATKLCDVVSHIVKTVEYKDDNQLFTEDCILINTTSTHLLTTLRYQAKFTDIFPKIIIQNALLEVVGGIYQLIYKAGCNLTESSNENTSTDVRSQKNKKDLNSSLPDRNITLLKDDSKTVSEEEESPVRPLKITQRLSSMPQFDDVDGSSNSNQNHNGAARKHSNTGLFSAMLLTPTTSKQENSPFISNTNNKNIKNLTLPLTDDRNINKNVTVTTPKKHRRMSSILVEDETSKNPTTAPLQTTPVKSHGVLNRVKAFEEQISSTESTPENNRVVKGTPESNKSHQRTPSRSSLEISNLQKRNSLQSIEDRASAFGELKQKSNNNSLATNHEPETKKVESKSETREQRSLLKEEDQDLNDLLHYLENESIEVISTIQSLLTSIKNPNATIVDLNAESRKIMDVVNKIYKNTLSSIEKNNELKTIGEYIITSLQDCERRMSSLIEADNKSTYPDKAFKQRLAGIAFDIAKNVKKLVKIVEELSLKKEIAHLDSQLV